MGCGAGPVIWPSQGWGAEERYMNWDLYASPLPRRRGIEARVCRLARIRTREAAVHTPAHTQTYIHAASSLRLVRIGVLRARATAELEVEVEVGKCGRAGVRSSRSRAGKGAGGFGASARNTCLGVGDSATSKDKNASAASKDKGKTSCGAVQSRQAPFRNATGGARRASEASAGG